MPDQIAQQHPVQEFLPSFGPGFLDDHAGILLNDPAIAIVEVVANSSDAGADRVDITWPESLPGLVTVEDNGTGMTRVEFTHRWRELSYNRVKEQGEEVSFPDGNKKSNRKAYGRNGKGRHAMFCFANDYLVQTWKDGQSYTFKVTRASGIVPFRIEAMEQTQKSGHGTVVTTEMVRNHLPVEPLRELIGSKFVADPSFAIYVNGEAVELTDIEHLCERTEVRVDGWGMVVIRRFDSAVRSRTSKQHGVAWWVHRRLVGEPSWKDFEGSYLDGRSAEAKRYTFVVEADLLADQVKHDWTDFHASAKTNAVRATVRQQLLTQIQQLTQDVRRMRKVTALQENRELLGELPPVSGFHVARFLDEIQKKCPNLGQDNLTDAVEVLARLEQARSGYALLQQLSELPSNDLDALSALLEQWTVHDMQTVLDELHRRLQLIEKLDQLVRDHTSDELHDIQPLFERGLWIFGPEYEGPQFMSNRHLSTIVEKFFGKKSAVLARPRKRPDFVALPDSSIGVYSSDAYDERSEVNGLSKVLIIELKRGGYQLTRDEVWQAVDYASEIRGSGAIQSGTRIVGFVLGTAIADGAREKITQGEHTTIHPSTYSTVLRQAHSRTFDLLKKLQETRGGAVVFDPDLNEVLNAPQQPRLFNDDALAVRGTPPDGDGRSRPDESRGIM